MTSGGFLNRPYPDQDKTRDKKDWSALSPVEKKQQRFKWWLSAEGIKFDSPKTEKAYKERVQRFIDVYEVRQPDRVPVSIPIGNLPAYRANLSYHDVMYDAEKTVNAWAKFNAESGLDTFASPSGIPSGKVFEMIDLRIYNWPGHGLPVEASDYQYVEGEYMTVDEYDDLIRDPSDFWMRVYLPRVVGVYEPFRLMQPYTDFTEIVHVNGLLAPFARKEYRASLRKLMAASSEQEKWGKVLMKYGRRSSELGYPAARGAFAKAPFDTIGDTLRGTRGVFMDMYRCPEKLHKAMDVMADITIDSVISTCNAANGLIAGFPLHKGADGWMSAKQFDTFYWPSLKKIMDALVKEGIIVSLFAEGGYDSRLEKFLEYPKGSIIWLFDKSDMAHAKKVFGNHFCISGNVPASVINTGTPAEVKAICRKLIETCAPGGGYILAPGNATVEKNALPNVRAMAEAALEYGVYK
jgi:uroporphyrinogen-III decarboxylase